MKTDSGQLLAAVAMLGVIVWQCVVEPVALLFIVAFAVLITLARRFAFGEWG